MLTPWPACEYYELVTREPWRWTDTSGEWSQKGKAPATPHDHVHVPPALQAHTYWL